MIPPIPDLPVDEQCVWALAYSAAYATRHDLAKVNPAVDLQAILQCVADGTVTAYRRLRDEPTKEGVEPSDARLSGDSNTQ